MDHDLFMRLLVAVLAAATGGLCVAALRLRRNLRQREEERMELLITLSSMVELKDPYTEGHCARTRGAVSGMGELLGLSRKEADEAIAAATLHDIGKVGVPDAILTKPAKLNEEEYALIKRHPEMGVEAVKAVERLRNVLPLIRHHHEAWDGSGYPDGLKGEAIPLGARIIAVLDAYDAMTSDRAYRSAMPPEAALAVLSENAGKQFDPRVVAAFLRYQATMADRMLDPVCGMPGKPKLLAIHSGVTLYFCSSACREEFSKHPEKYLSRQ